MSKKQPLKRYIASLDFAIHETVLFLDTHPTNRRALAYLNEQKKRRAAAIKEYESLFGPYVTAAKDAASDDRWTWIDGPWPWENEEE